jgi:hypothetical protein
VNAAARIVIGDHERHSSRAGGFGTDGEIGFGVSKGDRRPKQTEQTSDERHGAQSRQAISFHDLSFFLQQHKLLPL